MSAFNLHGPSRGKYLNHTFLPQNGEPPSPTTPQGCFPPAMSCALPRLHGEGLGEHPWVLWGPHGGGTHPAALPGHIVPRGRILELGSEPSQPCPGGVVGVPCCCAQHGGCPSGPSCPAAAKFWSCLFPTCFCTALGSQGTVSPVLVLPSPHPPPPPPLAGGEVPAKLGCRWHRKPRGCAKGSSRDGSVAGTMQSLEPSSPAAGKGLSPRPPLISVSAPPAAAPSTQWGLARSHAACLHCHFCFLPG